MGWGTRLLSNWMSFLIQSSWWLALLVKASMCFLPVEFDPQLLMPKSHSGHTFPSLKERKLYLYLLFLQKLSVMVNVTKGILVECDPAMKQVFTSLRAWFLVSIKIKNQLHNCSFSSISMRSSLLVLNSLSRWKIKLIALMHCFVF